MRLLLWLVWAAGLACGQSMEARFLTEFRRLDARGEIVAADAAGRPREIISPALIRNGYTSFHLVVKGPPGAAYWLYLASNPDKVLRPVLYRVAPSPPGRLEPLKAISDSAKFNEHGVGVYWLDLWTPAQTPVRRIRLEAQLNMGREFVITPLELRVQAGVAPSQAAPVLTARPVGSNSAAGPFALLGQALCSEPGGPPGGTGAAPGDALNIAAKLLRNAAQDVLLARKLAGPTAAASRAAWCALPRGGADPESYLSIRDAIWRASQ